MRVRRVHILSSLCLVTSIEPFDPIKFARSKLSAKISLNEISFNLIEDSYCHIYSYAIIHYIKMTGIVIQVGYLLQDKYRKNVW